MPLSYRSRLWFVCLACMPVLATPCTSHADNKIHKWTDEKGATHYGDRVPAKDAGRKSSILNQQGVVIRQPASEQAAEITVTIDPEQQRRDRALLATYTHESEIDLTRDRHLQVDQGYIDAQKQQRQQLITRNKEINKNIQTIQQQNRPIPAHMAQSKEETKAEITKLNGQIKSRESMMNATRQRFEDDKKRFMELKYPDLAN